MSEPGTTLNNEEIETIFNAFRELKHDINNTLAVVMALSEMAQRNPVHYEKLAKAVLDRGPEVVHKLNNFQMILAAKFKNFTPSDPEVG